MTILTEKYRPKTREDMVGNKEVIDKILAMVNTGNLTHMIFEGSPGVGKTTLAKLIGRTLYGKDFKANFLDLNASDERGIAVVQGNIKTFAKGMPFGFKFKICFLDEADMLTKEAQTALRRTMEDYSESTIFIFSVNHLEGLIEPIQSRCQTFRFGPINKVEMAERLRQIWQTETGAHADVLDAFVKIAEQANGDMRKAVNRLQLFIASGKPLTPENVDQVKLSDYGKKVCESLKTGRFLESRKILQEALEMGYSERYILDLMYIDARDDTLPFDKKAYAIEQLAETDYRLTQGINSRLAMDNLLMKLIGVYKVAT